MLFFISAFSDDDFLRVWKGLYYCMWMSDKPLVQEGLAEDFGSLLPCFGKPEVSAQFFGAFLKTMSLEWFGIDQWRIDKFLMVNSKVYEIYAFLEYITLFSVAAGSSNVETCISGAKRCKVEEKVSACFWKTAKMHSPRRSRSDWADHALY